MASEDWHTLQIGDGIRFVTMPTGFGEHNCHQETLAAYRTLIARRRPIRIHRLDELNMPWIRFRVREDDGHWIHHYLLINHDGWVRVRNRNRVTS